MKMRIATIAFLASAVVFHAQAINISGVVKNSEGSGIEGVTVRLGKTDMATTTGSGGSFRLTDNATYVKHQPHFTTFGGDCPFILKDNRLYFLSAAQMAEVKVLVFDCHGRLLFTQRKVASSMDHSITLPDFGSGIHIYHISMNNEQYTLKIVTATAITRGTGSSREELVVAKQAKVTAQINDALLFTKEGYQLFRCAVTKSDTSGIQATMSPLITGTVTDAEGNVYQTVKIGNQEWTTENLRATKYNDNTGIGSSYHFYNNVTDAAAKKKWGALYTWDAVKTGKLAPTGWHVATDAEWDTLQNYLIAHGYNYDGTLSGNKIAKSMCTKTDWPSDSLDTGAVGNDASKNNASGFSVIPAGYRYYDGAFRDQGNIGYFWTATEQDASYSLYRYLWYVDPFLSNGYRVKTIECSVRIVRHI
jgi:uncharacterized protein (TIGR02145 family)